MLATAEQSTLYEVLGVAENADLQTIRTAWRELVQEHHPDRVQDDAAREAATESAARINEAYHTLKDPRQRERYDSRLAYEAGQPTEPTPESAPRRPFANSSWSGATERRHQQHRPAPRAVSAAPTASSAISAADIRDAIRRHPRILATAAAIWIGIVGWGTVTALTSGPPSLSSIAAASSAPSISTAPIPAQAPSNQAPEPAPQHHLVFHYRGGGGHQPSAPHVLVIHPR